MCKRAFLYFVGVISFSFDNLENSYHQAGKKFEQGRKKISRGRKREQEKTKEKI
jgi:hypothetical protein